MTGDSIRVVLRLRTLGPAGLNPPQIEVIDRLQALTEDDLVTDLDVDVWGTSMEITQTEHRDPRDTQELMAEFMQWADAREYTLCPAFKWCSNESADAGERQIIPPLITLALYNGERLQAVYPHVNDDEVNTIHDGVEALESMTGKGDTEHSEDGKDKNQVVPLQ